MNGWTLAINYKRAPDEFITIENPDFIPRIGEKIITKFNSAPYTVIMVGYDYEKKLIGVSID